MLLPIALLSSFIALTAAQAQPGPPMLPPPPEALIERYAEELGIDEATLERIRALAEQHRTEQQGILTELQQQKLALRTALSAEQPDEAAVIALARKIGTLESDLSVARLTSLIRIRAALTPEQNAALREKMERGFAERRAQIDQVLTACEAEISQYCADQASGPPPHALMCLVEKRKTENVTVSAKCEAALKDLPPPPMFPPPEASDVMGMPPFHTRGVKESE
jgi:Spy/CpxP family protein refolding chaperone